MQIQQLEAEREAVQLQRESLTLQDLRMDFLEQVLTNLEGIVAAVHQTGRSREIVFRGRYSSAGPAFSVIRP